MRLKALATTAYLFLYVAVAACSAKHTDMPAAGAAPANAKVISGKEITKAFTNVRDEADIQDDAGTTAVNHWYGDGRFINRWKNANANGEVTGTWRVADDRRCVLIRSGLPGSNGKEKCSPVFRMGERYISFNADGSVHAFHAVTPLAEIP